MFELLIVIFEEKYENDVSYIKHLMEYIAKKGISSFWVLPDVDTKIVVSDLEIIEEGRNV